MRREPTMLQPEAAPGPDRPKAGSQRALTGGTPWADRLASVGPIVGLVLLCLLVTVLHHLVVVVLNGRHGRRIRDTT